MSEGGSERGLGALLRSVFKSLAKEQKKQKKTQKTEENLTLDLGLVTL